MTRHRILIAGLGDSGVLTAIRLARYADVTGISVKPGLLSGQELGTRLARPAEWAREYWVPFDRLRGLDRVRIVHASLTGLDLTQRRVFATGMDGNARVEPYDLLVISSGVRNGFWRTPDMQSDSQISAALRAAHDRLAAAESIAVVGGGASAVSSAVNLARVWPHKQVAMYFPGERALTGHHRRTWTHVERTLIDLGVRLYPAHRALVPDAFSGESITSDPIAWRTGQPDVHADAVLWTIGRVRPNTAWLPGELLDVDGFVRVSPHLQVPGHPDIFAIGDVAATDPLRSSARNRADSLLARNIRAALRGKPLRSYRPARRRWGSVLGPQPDGLQVFTPSGFPVRFPAWSIETILRPWIVHRGIYRGVRDNSAVTAGLPGVGGSR